MPFSENSGASPGEVPARADETAWLDEPPLIDRLSRAPADPSEPAANIRRVEPVRNEPEPFDIRAGEWRPVDIWERVVSCSARCGYMAVERYTAGRPNAHVICTKCGHAALTPEPELPPRPEREQLAEEVARV